MEALPQIDLSALSDEEKDELRIRLEAREQYAAMSEIERAILFAEQHREVHIQWRDWVRLHPRTSESFRRGTTVRNQETAMRYSRVIHSAAGILAAAVFLAGPVRADVVNADATGFQAAETFAATVQ